MSRIRSSKYRHVFANEPNASDTWVSSNFDANQGDGQHIKANMKYFAVPVKGGGGPVLVWDYEKTGKIGTTPPILDGHTADVIDLDFHPFYDNLLVTGGHDCTLKLWKIPDGGLTETIKDSILTMKGCRKKVMYTLFHPSADNVLATADGDKSVKVWDVASGEANLSIEGQHSKMIQDLKWNYDGSLLVTTSKDKTLRFFDPRTGSEPVVSTPKCHQGLKSFRYCELHNHNQFITCGFDRQANRVLKTWDMRANKKLKETRMDQSSGIMYPFYDEGTNLLYIFGRGDSNIRIYERTTSGPYEYACSNPRISEGVQGVAMVPKRKLDILNCETTRFIKLTAKNAQPICFTIPRKSQGMFQDELFPDDKAGVAALTSDEWFAGKNANPVLMCMDPETWSDKPKATKTIQLKAKKSVADLEKELAAARKKIAELKARRQQLLGQIAKAKKKNPDAKSKDDTKLENMISNTAYGADDDDEDEEDNWDENPAKDDAEDGEDESAKEKEAQAAKEKAEKLQKEKDAKIAEAKKVLAAKKKALKEAEDAVKEAEEALAKLTA